MKYWFGPHVELFNGASLPRVRVDSIQRICAILPLHIAPYGKVRWREDVGYKSSPEIAPRKGALSFCIIGNDIVISAYSDAAWQEVAVIPLMETVLAIKSEGVSAASSISLEKNLYRNANQAPPKDAKNLERSTPYVPASPGASPRETS